MFTKEALQYLNAQNIGTEVDVENEAILLPHDVGLHDLEKFHPFARRMRAHIKTNSLVDFGSYVDSQGNKDGAAVFVDQEHMTAKAVIDFMVPDFENHPAEFKPGHREHSITLSLRQTAAYSAILKKLDSSMTADEICHFIEDWVAYITPMEDDETPYTAAVAVQAFSSITVKRIKEGSHSRGNLSKSDGIMDSINIQSQEALPKYLDFRCQPYHGLEPVTLRCRVIYNTINSRGDDSESRRPTYKLQCAALDQIEEDMAEEMVALVKAECPKDLPVYLGTIQN